MSFASMKWDIKWLEQYTRLTLAQDMQADSVETLKALIYHKVNIK
jgi:hypothetical protein